MKSGGAIKRKTRINPISKTRRSRSGKPGKLGIVRLYGLDLGRLREQCLERSGGQCEFQRGQSRCTARISWDNFEMAHIVGHGAGGSDVIDNVMASCKWRRDGKPGCHTLSHNANGKPCPRKVV